ncbi:MAG TPA: hypothetical protein VHA73_16315 [Acidimicrobiales bacterium]|jgi:hypothetical protein|nr:hypothetical protein [Acidimicrobiales bacterium]
MTRRAQRQRARSQRAILPVRGLVLALAVAAVSVAVLLAVHP